MLSLVSMITLGLRQTAPFLALLTEGKISCLLIMYMCSLVSSAHTASLQNIDPQAKSLHTLCSPYSQYCSFYALASHNDSGRRLGHRISLPCLLFVDFWIIIKILLLFLFVCPWVNIPTALSSFLLRFATSSQGAYYIKYQYQIRPSTIHTWRL